MAVKAALTGHLVLSTLHTNDAPSTVNRLLNMGVEPFLVSSALNLVCAQRLVRRVCETCREDTTVSSEALIEAGADPADALKAKPTRGRGCDRCGRTGYRGRVGLFEVMTMTEGLREQVLGGASAPELRRQAIADGMVTLRRTGLRKVCEGVTTMEEVVRETVS
jgi:type IV pilus assembly protein PilB